MGGEEPRAGHGGACGPPPALTRPPVSPCQAASVPQPHLTAQPGPRLLPLLPDTGDRQCHQEAQAGVVREPQQQLLPARPHQRPRGRGGGGRGRQVRAAAQQVQRGGPAGRARAGAGAGLGEGGAAAGGDGPGTAGCPSQSQTRARRRSTGCGTLGEQLNPSMPGTSLFSLVGPSPGAGARWAGEPERASPTFPFPSFPAGPVHGQLADQAPEWR